MKGWSTQRIAHPGNIWLSGSLRGKTQQDNGAGRKILEILKFGQAYQGYD